MIEVLLPIGEAKEKNQHFAKFDQSTTRYRDLCKPFIILPSYPLAVFVNIHSLLASCHTQDVILTYHDDQQEVELSHWA